MFLLFLMLEYDFRVDTVNAIDCTVLVSIGAKKTKKAVEFATFE